MFLFCLIHKSSYVLSSLDVSEIIVSEVSLILFLYDALHLNFFLSCSIKNLSLASLSRLFTMRIDVVFPF